ncbi:unnamed protein product [Ceratitis capitata]|uniref:(Mediterranean fruit fly) hypothetical protein n=1 Tax=Ceratitis capitata TaxID=7213 RepID=A0A811V065_CERCA|nr:unnamed protein product [Ceratitis capitata]
MFVGEKRAEKQSANEQCRCKWKSQTKCRPDVTRIINGLDFHKFVCISDDATITAQTAEYNKPVSIFAPKCRQYFFLDAFHCEKFLINYSHVTLK